MCGFQEKFWYIFSIIEFCNLAKYICLFLQSWGQYILLCATIKNIIFNWIYHLIRKLWDEDEVWSCWRSVLLRVSYKFHSNAGSHKWDWGKAAKECFKCDRSSYRKWGRWRPWIRTRAMECLGYGWVGVNIGLISLNTATFHVFGVKFHILKDRF